MKVKHKLFSIIAIGSIISTSPAFAFSCASETLEHIKLAKKERKKVGPILRSLFKFVDAQDVYATKIEESYAFINGERVDCNIPWDKLQANCGPLTLTEAYGSGRYKMARTIPHPLNAPYPFNYAVFNSEEYALVSRYAINDRFHQFLYNTKDPNWLAPANAASIKQCKSWEELENDPYFSRVVKFELNGSLQNGYAFGNIVCIEDVKCSEKSATTTLSVNASLIPLKYLPTLRAIGDNIDDENWSSWKTYLEKINPILKRDDIVNVKFNIVISSPMEFYSSPL